MSCPCQPTQLAEFHSVILTTQLVEFLVSSNSPSSLVHHWAVDVFSAQFIQDVDGDGLPDVLAAHTKDLPQGLTGTCS
jgi:hypothetical protein